MTPWALGFVGFWFFGMGFGFWFKSGVSLGFVGPNNILVKRAVRSLCPVALDPLDRVPAVRP